MSAAQGSRWDLLAGPFRELLNGLDAVLHLRVRSLLLVAAGLVAGWWIYVPAHELLHALGCWLSGGEVSRLEIDPIYGARWLAQLFPFVTPGGEYAGRLAGFDTHGSDWVYWMTDLAPFALALFPGFWGLRRAARAGWAVAFGASLPFALAPLLSLTGDAYEMGSLAVVHLPMWRAQRELIGDDLTAKLAEILLLSDPGKLAGVVAAALIGLLWALCWISIGRALATVLGEPPLSAGPAAPRAPAGITLGS